MMRGVLEFRSNDFNFDDNLGALQVRVVTRRVTFIRLRSAPARRP